MGQQGVEDGEVMIRISTLSFVQIGLAAFSLINGHEMLRIESRFSKGGTFCFADYVWITPDHLQCIILVETRYA